MEGGQIMVVTIVAIVMVASIIRAAVGGDLLEHADPLLELGRTRCILGGLLGRVQGFDLELPLAEFEKAVEGHHQHDRR